MKDDVMMMETLKNFLQKKLKIELTNELDYANLYTRLDETNS